MFISLDVLVMLRTEEYLDLEGTSIIISREGTFGKYCCEICNAQYKNIKSLIRHRKYDCGVEPQFTCEFCNSKFRRNYYLQDHLGICRFNPLRDLSFKLNAP